VAELRRSPLSGDWRYCPEVGGLELIAALAVNSPGFPVTEVVDGVQFSMTSAGMIGEEVPTDFLIADAQQVEETLTADELVQQAADELERREARTARLATIMERQQIGRVDRLAKLMGE
jgi:hypothetical protein